MVKTSAVRRAHGVREEKTMKHMLRMACVLLALVLMSATACAHEDHKFGSYKTKISATCTHTGLQFRYCTGCDHWEKREIPKLPHTLETWTVTQEPTCTAKGMQEAYCTVCNTRVRHFIDMLPHEYGEMEVVVEPTCTQSGKGQYVCASCGRKKGKTLPELGHDWLETRVIEAATCKKAGSAEFVCQRCGKSKTRRVARLEHEWTDWTVKKEPQGKTRGTREGVCALCGETTTQRFYWEGTLYEDMTPNDDVIRLQEMLRDLGYYNGKIRSGTFGSVTGKAVARFQKDNGLEATGVADPETLELIKTRWQEAGGQSAAE